MLRIVFKNLRYLQILNLESNILVYFNRYALKELHSIKKVCLFNNTMSKYKPTILKDVCSFNSNCIVEIKEKCL